MREYAVALSIPGHTMKRRDLSNIPSAKALIPVKEEDFLNIDKLPGGNTPENVRVIAQRLREYERKIKYDLPERGAPEYRTPDV